MVTAKTVAIFGTTTAPASKTKQKNNDHNEPNVKGEGAAGGGSDNVKLQNTLKLMNIERCYRPRLLDLCTHRQSADPLLELEPKGIFGRANENGETVPMAVARGLVRKIRGTHTVLPAVEEARKRIQEKRKADQQRSKQTDHQKQSKQTDNQKQSKQIERPDAGGSVKEPKLITLRNIVVPRYKSSFGLVLAPSGAQRRAFVYSLKDGALSSDSEGDGISKLQKGDVLLKINSVDVINMAFEDVVKLVRKTPEGKPLVLDVCRKSSDDQKNERKLGSKGEGNDTEEKK